MAKALTQKIFPILLVNFIGTMGYSIVLPFLVIVVLKFGGNEVIYGLIGATYSFFQLIGAPILGSWSDKIGRRKVLLLSQAGTFLAWVVFILAMLLPKGAGMNVDSSYLGAFVLTVPLVLIFAARALDGLTGGNVSVANAYLADISTDIDRKQNFGLMSASANLGFIIGPALAGILGATILGDMLPIILAMIISLVAIFVIYFNLEDFDPCLLNKPTETQKTRKVLGQELKECHDMLGQEKYGFRQVLALPGIAPILITYFLIFLAFNFFYVSFPIHAIQSLEWSLFKMGIFFSTMSGVMVLVQGPLLSRLSKKTSDWNLFIIGNFILAGGFLLFSSPRDWVLFAGVALFSLGNGLMWPSFLSILSQSAGEKYQGAVQGFASSAGSLASIIGLVIGGFVYQAIGKIIFVIPSVLIIGICIFILFSLKKKPSS